MNIICLEDVLVGRNLTQASLVEWCSKSFASEHWDLEYFNGRTHLLIKGQQNVDQFTEFWEIL
jgi:hypothetical protein